MVVHTCNQHFGGYDRRSGVRGQAALDSKFKANLSFIVRCFSYPPTLKKKSINAIHHCNKLKLKNQRVLSWGSEKINVAKL